MLNRVLRFAREILSRPSDSAGGGQQPFGRLVQQPFTGAIDQAQPMVAIEGKYRHVDLFHHFAQQRRGFERA